MAASCSSQEETPVSPRMTGEPRRLWTGDAPEGVPGPQEPVFKLYEPRLGIYAGHVGILYAIRQVAMRGSIG